MIMRGCLADIFCRCTGSTLPRAGSIALPCAILATALNVYLRSLPNWEEPELTAPMAAVWAGISGLLAFTLGFRCNQSYSRYWEGVSACMEMRSAWYNVASATVAFCSASPKNWHEKANFVGLIVRMTSLLYATAVQDIVAAETAHFEVISCQGISMETLEYLKGRTNKVEVILHWLQRIIVDAVQNKVVSAPPPIATRVFSDITTGLQHFNSACKLKEHPFPFPYSQAISALLVFQSIGVVAGCALTSTTADGAFFACLAYITFFWAFVFIAEELEMPFGDDPNDIELVSTVVNMNHRLRSLLDQEAQIPPTFDGRHAKDDEIVFLSWVNEDVLTEFLRTSLSEHPPAPPRQSRRTSMWSATSKSSPRRNPRHSRTISTDRLNLPAGYMRTVADPVQDKQDTSPYVSEPVPAKAAAPELCAPAAKEGKLSCSVGARKTSDASVVTEITEVRSPSLPNPGGTTRWSDNFAVDWTAADSVLPNREEADAPRRFSQPDG